MPEKINTLYLCYFGLREPLVQTQVLPYLREISKLDNLQVRLLTFEFELKKNWTKKQAETEKKKLADENIEWHYLPYHKTPSATATLYDVLNGVRFILNLHRKSKIDILHARAHIPMLVAMIASRFTKSKTIFDIRGLMADEYADAGTWRENSKVFRFVKLIERKGIEQASQIVVLTNRMRDYLVENNLRGAEDIEVIPCCVDFSRVEKTVSENEKNKRFELIYAGTTTGLYLLREMGMFFIELKKHKPNAFFRILTASPPEGIKKVFDELKLTENDYTVAKVSPAEVPEYLKRAHLGISFRTPTFSQIAASPTKIPEYLACGLPVISNTGIGDTDYLLESGNVGLSLDKFDNDEIKKAVLDIIRIMENPENLQDCVKIAVKHFDLEKVGGERYRNAYRRLINLNS